MQSINPLPDAPPVLDAPISEPPIDAAPSFTVMVRKNGNGTGSVTSSSAGIGCGIDCIEVYPAGTSVTLTASPDPGTTFVGWSGGGCTGTGTCTFTVTADTNVTASFGLNNSVIVTVAGNGTGTVTSAPPGIDCGTICSATYAPGTLVTLTAAAANGSTFTGWSGGGCTGTADCTLTVTAAVAVTATFTLKQFALTFTLRGFGGGTGSVASNPPGISCSANCTQTANFNFGTTVTLTKTGTGTPASLSYWSKDCTSTGACSVTMTADHAVMATFSHTNYIFVTATSHDGNWGGTLANADAFCNAEASNSGLPGNYVAWISNATTTASARLGSARGWMRLDGRPFADTVASLTGSTSNKVFYPPAIDAHGTTLTGVAIVVTGTHVDGSPVTDQNCNNWTASDNTTFLSGGIATGGSGEWSDDVGTSCGPAPWYCMGTNFATVAAPTPVAGRKAFVLSAPWNPSLGIANADTRCQNDAAQFGLANPSAFKAFLATTSASASSRFNLSGTPWVRTDGVQVVATTGDIATGALMASITVGPEGTFYNPSGRVWGGASAANAVGTAATSCANWTTNATGPTATVGIIGWANVGSFAWNAGWPCQATDVKVDCLEN